MQHFDKDKPLPGSARGWYLGTFGLAAGVLGSVPEPDTLAVLGVIAPPEHHASSVIEADEQPARQGVPGIDEFIQDQLDP